MPAAAPALVAGADGRSTCPRRTPEASRACSARSSRSTGARLVRLATEHGCVIELLPRVGEYVAHGRSRSSPCTAALHPTTGGSWPASTSAGSRSLYQDPTFGIRQLVDVGTQALSPAINQMTTAVR